VDLPAHTIAQQSYSRCLRIADFFARFYDRFLSSDPAIPPMFAGTEFPRQHKLLQHGLGLLLSYAKNPDPMLLDRLAARHSAAGLDVPPPMYDLFLESLVTTVRESDPRFDESIEAAWRAAMQPGVEFMRARYDA
jgi:hemoglobin-like flavoprotein